MQLASAARCEARSRVPPRVGEGRDGGVVAPRTHDTDRVVRGLDRGHLVEEPGHRDGVAVEEQDVVACAVEVEDRSVAVADEAEVPAVARVLEALVVTDELEHPGLDRVDPGTHVVRQEHAVDREVDRLEQCLDAALETGEVVVDRDDDRDRTTVARHRRASFRTTTPGRARSRPTAPERDRTRLARSPTAALALVAPSEAYAPGSSNQ